MSLVHKTSFSGLSLAAAQTYCTDLLSEHPKVEDRRAVFAYLWDVFSKDQKTLRSQQNIISQLGAFLQKEVVKHEIDFSKTPSLFTASTVTDAQIITYLAQSGSEVFLENKQVIGDITLGGGTLLQGFSNGLSARDSLLVCSAKVTGSLTISGSDCVIKGVEFTSTSDKAIQFTGTHQNVTFEDCVFDMDGHNMWFYGDGFGGTVVIRNCWVKNEGVDPLWNWFTADFSTGSSATPSQKLDSVIVDQCYFDGITGNIAVRGIVANPNGAVTFTNNKFRYENQSALLWAVLEANNTQEVTCTGNVVTGVTKVSAGEVALLQTWARSGAWRLTFQNNSMDSLNFVIQIPGSATFYNPTHATSVVENGTGVVTNADYGASFTYPFIGGTYAPVDIAQYPTPIAVSLGGLPNTSY